MSTLCRTEDLARRGAERLSAAGVEHPLLESQLLIAKAAGRTRLDILAHPERQVTDEQRAVFLELIARRESRIPLAYLRGVQEFYGLEFEIDSSVLIPRPETELLVDFARQILADVSEPVLWDVGTGSGCIAIACAAHLPDADVYASDLSRDALTVAERNAARHEMRERIRFVAADLLSAAANQSVTLVVSNPPYISPEEIPGLQPEIRLYEPRIALEAPEQGMAIHRRLAAQTFAALLRHGWLALEVAQGQAQRVSALFIDLGFQRVGSIKDLAGIERVVVGQKP